MNIPKNTPIPDEPENLPPARRRRQKRLLAALDGDERATAVDKLARRTSPPFDFYLYSLLSAVVFAAAIFLDLPALFLLGAVIAPLIRPLVGLGLSSVAGSVSLFLRSLTALLVGCLLVFVVGVVAGLISIRMPVVGLTQSYAAAQLSWVNLLVLAVGAVLTSAFLARKSYAAAAPGVALAVGLYIPLVVAGFGLTSRTPHLWPDGLVVFVIHMAWGAALSALTLALIGFRPLTLFGYTVGTAFALAGVVLAIGMSGAGAAFGAQIALPTFTPTLTPTLTPVPPTLTPSLTPTLTPTLTPLPPTLTPTLTPSITPSPTLTPVFAMIGVTDGAVIRNEPGGTVVASYLQGVVLIVLDETPVLQNGREWTLVRGPDGKQGWILSSLLIKATPSP